MKILLINPKIRSNALPMDFPIGLGIIASIMLKKGHDVNVYDENALRPADISKALASYTDIDIVGIGGLITTYKHVKQIIPILKTTFPDAKIVLGGGITIDPEVIFRNMPDVDFCVHGEGETTFFELCDSLEKGNNDFSEIEGISYFDRTYQKIVITKPREIERDLDKFPMPAYDLFPSEIYFKNLKNWIGHGATMAAALMWSRGCPNQCSFCWRMAGKTVRFRSIESVMNEIAYLRDRYNIDSYLFNDECINANRNRSIEFAKEIIGRGFTGPWYSHARVSNFDDELADFFKRSGCIGLNFGIESGSDKILKVINKNVSTAQADRAVMIAARHGINQICTFVLGMPGETKETIEESIAWIRRNRPTHSFFFIATPYPGCDLYYTPLVQERMIDKYKTKDAFFSDLGDAVKLTINMTDFSDDDLLSLRQWAIKSVQRSIIYRIIQLLLRPDRWRTVLMNEITAFTKRSK